MEPNDIISCIIFIIWLISTISCWRHWREKWTRLFILAISLTLLFSIAPLLLKSPVLFGIVDCLSSGLRYSEYKSSFLESLGGMMGTALAIIGALWTQHYFDQEQELKREAEFATIVYYDLKFAFTEVKEIMDKCFSDDSNKTKFDSFKTGLEFKDYRILIDYKWISNVARLSNRFSAEDIETIYYIYGLINSINLAIEARNSTLMDKLSTFYQIAPQNTPWNDALKCQHERVVSVYHALEKESKKREKL